MIALREERAAYTPSSDEADVAPVAVASATEAPAHPGNRPPATDDAAASPVRPGDRPPATHLTEAHLTALWQGRRFPEGALVTRTGVPVNVIFQGRPGRGPGPDFRGAVVAGPSGLPLRGDVELHVRSSSFRAHGHAEDPAYANVILHVVFEDDDGEDTALPGGGSAPVVALAPWVARRAGEMQRWLERPLLWREPCHDAVMRLGADGAAAALEAEGDRRLDSRAARFAETVRAAGFDQALYEGVLGALGYGGNAPPMFALARLLPWRALARRVARAEDRRFAMEALLLGSAGLLPSQRSHCGPVEPYVLRAEAAFARAGLPSLGAGVWKLWGVRPENAAPRRIAAAAALLDALATPRALLAVLDATTVNEAVRPLTAARADGFWASRYDLVANPCRMPAAFVGRSRALEIIVNVVLPAARASGDPELASKALTLYAKLPRPAAYGVTRFLENALGSEGVKVPLNARRAQGLLALHRDWCTQGGCGRCPLSE
jgi:hypothetical protein